ncbi:MAG: DUF3604 domain-containing protein [Pseudomonadota bacterium]
MKHLWAFAGLAIVLSACGQTASDTDSKSSVKTDVATIDRNPDRNAYFGDLHVHTRSSFDAYIFNVRTTPEDAYRFARGEAIGHGGGFDIQLSRPLDFLAVTDHGEYLGIVPAMADPENALSQTDTAKASFGTDLASQQAAFLNIGQSFVNGTPIEEINDQDYMNSVWANTVAATEKYNEPGVFTSFAGYEFTAMVPIGPDGLAAANLHRNVIFRDEAPTQLFTTLNSTNPEDLWEWMDLQRSEGRDVLAIPHNSNASNGWMFAGETYVGGPMDSGYVKTRLKNEPIVEITQLKGTSETHPLLSPNDEWAGFEQYEYFIGSTMRASINEGDFIRKALARGLTIEDSLGANPYAFGLIGSSDTHLGAATLKEETYWGKFTIDGATPEARSSVPPGGARTWEEAPQPPGRLLSASQYSASGLAGVWAEANTRDDLFDAMQRRETFGTSGPRIQVRFFAGQDFEEEMLREADLISKAYKTGVPMGGDLVASNPGFIAWAMRDAQSAPLQRLQIIKVWTEAGALNEALYDIACSGEAIPDPETHRCPDNGARVDIATCETTTRTGASELKTFWRDPDFDRSESAVYYIRVLENPTCRWSTWDAVRNGTPPNPELPTTLQERAWSSPIFLKSPG